MRFGWPVAPAAPSEISSPSLNYELQMSVNSNRHHEKYAWALLKTYKQSAGEDFGDTCQLWQTCDEMESCSHSNSMIDFTIKVVSPNTQTAPLGANNKNKS